MAQKNQYGTDAYLDPLSMEQLEELLQSDLASLSRENERAVFHILEVIERREKETPTGRLPDTNQAWKEFQQYYNIPEGDGISLYPAHSYPKNRSASTPKKTSRRSSFRKVITAIIIIALMFGVMLTAQSAGIDVFGAIGRWTEETFHFELSSTKTDGSVDHTFQEVISKKGLPKSLVPTWFPEGFKPSEPIDDSVEGYVDSIYCEYFNAERNKAYFVMVSRYYNSEAMAATVYEKDSTQVEIYQNDRRSFYIMSNLDSMTAVWTDGTISIDITGQLEADQIKHIIDSIGK